MPPKPAPNGFYMYMQDQRKKIQTQTRRTPSMKEMAAICKNSWQNLRAAERARYDNLAKQEKQRLRSDPEKDKYRLDNQGEVIAYRVNERQEEKKRREKEMKAMVESWKNKDILHIEFHLINFQVMYLPKNHLEDHDHHYLPMEVGMACFTLQKGIQKSFSQFINPGDPPQGNRHLAIQHSELTHKIPLNFDEADDNFLSLWMKMEKFLVENPNHDDMPPVFCLSTDIKIVESCLEFIHMRAKSGAPMRLRKVYCMEDLFTSLMLQSGKVTGQPAEHQVFDMLRQNRWDYNSSIRCTYHENEDCSHCSLSIVKRTSFALFDNLAELIGFKLTEKHMPDEAVQPRELFTVFKPPSSLDDNTRRMRRGGSGSSLSGSRGDMSATSSVRSSSPPSFATPVPQPSPRGAVGVLPVARMQEIKLSDEDASDDEEREGEIPSTADRYQLKELRKPKTPSIIQSMGPQAPPSSLGRGLAAFAARDMNEMAAPRPNAWGRSRDVTLPPGMAPLPGMAPHPHVDLAASSDGDQWPTLGVGRGVTRANPASGVGRGNNPRGSAGRQRGRGMPRQIP